ncbi:putative dna replication licensing factor mcm6 protein [Rhypophila sp. PSN 637]
MSKPILSLVEPKTATDDKLSTTATVTPHLLPCRIHHDGSVEPVQSFWDPTVSEDGKHTAYFRGRKLDGKSVQLPDGYRGIIAAAAQDGAQIRRPEEENPIDLEQEGGQPETGKLQVQAEFDEMIIWGHEATADASADPYVRGMEEWLALADQIHSFPTSSTDQ